MPQFTLHDATTAPDASRPLLEAVRKSVGFVPNLYGTFAESPAVLKGYLDLSAALDRGTLTPAERELVHIAVSTENDCTYCVAAHSTLAGMKRADPEALKAVRAGRPPADPRLAALIAVVREALRQGGRVSDATVTQFLSSGYSRAQLLEVLAHVGLKTIANYINNLAETPLDEAFQAQAWTSAELETV